MRMLAGDVAPISLDQARDELKKLQESTNTEASQLKKEVAGVS